MNTPQPHVHKENTLGLRSRVGLVAGPLVLLAVLWSPTPSGLSTEAWRTAAVALLMAVWWISEAVPIAATALLPLALFPVLGIASMSKTAAPYANPVIFLFMGGFMLAQGIQRWGLHRRAALHVVRAIGTEPRRMVGGFMLATALLSMWVSNTATTVMMLPIGLSVIDLVRRNAGADHAGEVRNLGLALMLGIAYASSIGGIATLIGTPPNALFAGFMNESYGVQIGFAQWMLVGTPITVVMLPVAWKVLTAWIFPIRLPRLQGGAELIDGEIRSLGRMSRGESLSGLVFVLVAAAWVLRPLFQSALPGLSDAGIAMIGALVLFALPVDLKRGEFALDWRSASRIPWDVLVLFGGGLSLADAIRERGLAEWIGATLSGVGTLPILATMLIVSLLLIFLTELTSNTATAATFLPVLASLALGVNQNPLWLVVPGILAVSCAFMLPVATPPNAIVFGSGQVQVPQMARAGLVLNLLFAVVIPLASFALLWLVFGARPGIVPIWAR